jgi:hypothetical protein
MARIAGIQIEKNAKGVPTKVTIDLKKHGALFTPLLEQVGAIEEDEFEREWREGITGDELVKRVHAHIDTLPWKK